MGEIGAGADGPAGGGGGGRAASGAEGEGVAVGVGAVVAFARLSNLPPDAPVKRSVVPTDTRNMRVYFLVGSSSADSLAVGVAGREEPEAGGGVDVEGETGSDMLS